MWVCSHCGSEADPESEPAIALTWTTSVEGTRFLRYCPTCSRLNLRSIEGKLDEVHW
jgi:hypothetical protein